mmetsp:Transcript_11016/g.25986  ORF Transcript_11016/g.25986 Transcript_11016/m.25986 type:complete len:329 (+) Transcript_11016:220-1206(+)|eukprot:1810958-Rhodomonas_salina.2
MISLRRSSLMDLEKRRVDTLRASALLCFFPTGAPSSACFSPRFPAASASCSFTLRRAEAGCGACSSSPADARGECAGNASACSSIPEFRPRDVSPPKLSSTSASQRREREMQGSSTASRLLSSASRDEDLVRMLCSRQSPLEIVDEDLVRCCESAEADDLRTDEHGAAGTASQSLFCACCLTDTFERHEPLSLHVPEENSLLLSVGAEDNEEAGLMATAVGLIGCLPLPFASLAAWLTTITGKTALCAAYNPPSATLRPAGFRSMMSVSQEFVTAACNTWSMELTRSRVTERIPLSLHCSSNFSIVVSSSTRTCSRSASGTAFFCANA